MLFSALPAAPPPGWPAMVIVALTVVYLSVMAIRSRPRYRRLLTARDSSPTALTDYYRRNVVRKCGWVVPVLGVLLLAPGWRPAIIGLAWPHGLLAPYATQLFALSLVALAGSSVFWRRRAQRGRSVPGQRLFGGLLPRTRTERRWAWAVALSAGVLEELLFRGVLLAFARSLGLDPVLALAITSVLFGLIHWYQGPLGMLLLTPMGAVFGYFVLVSGSLLFAVLLHVLIDVRALLVVPAATDRRVDPEADVPVSTVDAPVRPVSMATPTAPRPAGPDLAPPPAAPDLAPQPAGPDLGWEN